MTSTYRSRLMTTTLIASASMFASPAFGQEVQEPVVADTPAEAAEATQPEAGEEIVVTGSRIARPNLVSNSPIAVVTGEQVVEQGDITLETYLNTLPQANPAGTTTSNNPGNGGAANIDLRGLGSNRNLVLIDGRRPMVSDTLQRVDLNTIPQGLIERIEVITGGAGAAYGADAIAGVVNIITKDDFEGVDLRASYANSIPETDAYEYQVSGTLGANFDDGKGNVAVSAEFSKRQGLIKAQREFAQQATSTTGTFPTGRLTPNAAGSVLFAGNPIPQSAIDALFLSYGSLAKDIPTQGLLGFNSDGTLFGIGTFNNPRDVTNYRYDPLGLDAAAANQNFFPDFYSYNFDIVNLLVLPLERKSVFINGNYEIDPHAELFVRGGYTEYESQTALAPTPVGVNIRAPGQNSVIQASTPLISAAGCTNSAGTPVPCNATGFVVPVTNPFIPADLAALLAARTGDSATFVGSGATEPFNIGYRFLGTGLREQQFENRVLQGLVGLRGDITDNWRYETYISWGRTQIDTAATGNVNVQRVQELLEDPLGGVNICEGGFNPFGIQPISQDCVEFVDETGNTSTEFTQRIIQGFVTGKLAELPAGDLAVVLGAEHRSFQFAFDPGALFGPIAGFNTAVPAGGSNTFMDYFGELLIPIVKDQPWADELELNLTARRSTAEFKDDFAEPGEPEAGTSKDWSYGGTLSWAPNDWLRFRASYQRAVRAPNFGELFSGGGSFPQIFDPCSITSNFRTTGGAAAAALCSATGLGAQTNTFVQTPGGQAFITFTGNTNLSPEKADTVTLGAVFNRWGFSGSIDYYRIKLNDVIFFPTVNMVIAGCYGFHGLNTNLSAASPFCTSLFRSGGNIVAVFADPAIGGDPDTGYFQYINQGTVKTSGIDFQLGYSLPTEFLAERSKLNLNLLVNYLIEFKQEEFPGLVLDYADTVSYFGAGLGTSFPRWKGNLSAAWSMDPITLSTRIRYIDGMKNRAAVQFPGEEASFTGTKSVFYFDFAAEANIDAYTLRIGVNNAFDKQPPSYAPNVQSGTDPSLFDVIGRRAYVQARLRF